MSRSGPIATGESPLLFDSDNLELRKPFEEDVSECREIKEWKSPHQDQIPRETERFLKELATLPGRFFLCTPFD
jgi:hypothetical protein